MAYLDPGLTGTAQQARDQFNTVARQRRGSDLTDAEFNDLGARVGVTGDSVSGKQYNQALDFMGWGDPAPSGGVPQPTQPQPTQPAQPGQPLPTPRTGGIDPGQPVNQTDPSKPPPPTTSITGVAIPGAEPTPRPGMIDPSQPVNVQDPSKPTPSTFNAQATLTGATQQSAGGSMTLTEATTQIQNAFQQRFGRPMTAQEQQLAADHARQNGWDGVGNVPQGAFDAVMTAMAGYQGGGTPPQTGGPDPAPGQTPPPPQTGGPDPSPGGTTPGQGMPAAQATQQIQAAFQTKFGRPMSAEEQTMAADMARQHGWDGVGNVPQAAFDAVMAAMQSYQPPGTPAPGTPGTPTPTPGTPAPGGNIDPNVAQGQINDAFKQKFGRVPTAQEMQWLQTMAGYSGGPITPEMMTKAMDAIGKYTGNVDTPMPKPEDPTQTAARKRLEELLGLSYGEVDVNAPQIRQQQSVFEGQSQRATNRQRAAQAERAAHEGAAGTGGADVMQDALMERQGQANAANEANLVAGELQDQRKNLMSAIELAMQTGQQDKARELQDKLGMLDIDLRKYLGKGQLGLGLLQAKMGDQQFYDKLGFDYAGLQNKANSDSILALLQGGY